MNSKDWLALMLKQDRVNNLPCDGRIEELPPFQQHAALRVVDLLRRKGGCLLADEVGLGKTHIAAAAMESFANSGSSTLVIAPAGLLQMWRRVVGATPGVRFVSFASLVRCGVPSPHHGWDLIVVDEAHRLRNRATKRFKSVRDLSLGVPLLLITATPMHNDLSDAVSLLALLAGSLNADSLERLRNRLMAYVVRRTRPLVHAFYGSSVERWKLGPNAVFHSPCLPLSAQVRDLLADWEAFCQTAFPDLPSEVLRLVDRMLLKRAESSPIALFKTIERSLLFLERAEEAARVGKCLTRSHFRRLFGADPFWTAGQQVFPFFYDGLDSKPMQQLGVIRDRLTELLHRSKANFTREDDPKLNYLKQTLAQDSHRTRVIVSCFRDTAEYLFRALGVVRSVLVSGTEARSGLGARLSRREALLRFSPNSHNARIPAVHRFSLMIATDTISEGVNLQDADQLIHYDTPWNPITIQQREGRLIRLGSNHNSVEVIRFGVPIELESRLGIVAQLNSKRAATSRLIADATLLSEPLDRDALTMGAYFNCCSSQHPSCPPPEDLRGVWFVAVCQGGRVSIVACGDCYTREASPIQLLRLSAGVRGHVEEGHPPGEIVARTVRLVRQAAATRRWADLQPRVARNTGPRTSPKHLARLQYRLGDVSVRSPATGDEDLAIRLLGAIRLGSSCSRAPGRDQGDSPQTDSPLAPIPHSR